MTKGKWENILKISGRCYGSVLENLCCSSSRDLPHLKRLGVLKNNSHGKAVLQSTPSKRFHLPNLNAIKSFEDIRRLKKEDRIWLSM